ncbi:glycosyltransferase family 2 protein [Paenibacillus sp. FSL K6-1230]|uniref:glycosyltransferase family 2 protein n=1 Tax=Paenibacillus sp. FSL K6-1230 TaxID=2921603 RepID=UPI0030F6C761
MEQLTKIKKLIEAGEISEAKSEINQFENEFSQLPEFYSMKSVIAVMEEDYEEAERVLIHGLEIDTNHVDLLYNMAFICDMKKDFLQARIYYKHALRNTQSAELKTLICDELESLQLKINETDTSSPLVSIVVLAYNNLEYTRLCVESILQFTSHINYELITVDNGSSDGTREYFHSIPNATVVCLKENIGPTRGFNEGIKAARGKYTACVCNDFIFTPRWLDNLLQCIESDDSIGFVSPGANHISNMQQIKGDYSTVQEMLHFAEEYNHSDPKKWEERVRLLPCVLMVRTPLLKELGGYDERFYFGEFADDDIGFRIRRSGYKLIFCKDTFTFHYGSITTGHDQRVNNSLQKSRQIFYHKYGVDAWSDAVFNPLLTRKLAENPTAANVQILGINSKCGGNPLQLKNYLRENGTKQVLITNYCIDEKYIIDLKTVSNRTIYGQLSNITHGLENEKYNYIILEHKLAAFKENPTLLQQIDELLIENGYFGFLLEMNGEEKKADTLIASLNEQGYTILAQHLFSDINGESLIVIGQKGGGY